MVIFINKEDSEKNIFANNRDIFEGEDSFYIKSINMSLPKSMYEKTYCVS